MGKAGQDSVRLALGEIEQAVLEGANAFAAKRNLVTQVKPDIGRDLVVARAPGMQFLARVAD
jgi:hypothetical protein